MAITNGDPILASELNTEFDKERADLQASNERGRVDGQLSFEIDGTLNSALAKRLRGVSFTPQDDLELVMVAVHTYDATANGDVTAYLEVDGAPVDESALDVQPSRYLLEQAVKATKTTTVTAREHERTSFIPVTGTRLFLLAGIRYHLILYHDNAGAETFTEAILYYKTRRRRA